jgi:hypothetical protein
MPRRKNNNNAIDVEATPVEEKKEELVEENKLSPEQLAELVEKGTHLFCEKHGDITNSSMYLHFTVGELANKEIQDVHRFYCYQCLDELLQKFTQQGLLGKLKLGLSEDLIKTMGIKIPEDVKEEEEEQK